MVYKIIFDKIFLQLEHAYLYPYIICIVYVCVCTFQNKTKTLPARLDYFMYFTFWEDNLQRKSNTIHCLLSYHNRKLRPINFEYGNEWPPITLLRKLKIDNILNTK